MTREVPIPPDTWANFCTAPRSSIEVVNEIREAQERAEERNIITLLIERRYLLDEWKNGWQPTFAPSSLPI